LMASLRLHWWLHWWLRWWLRWWLMASSLFELLWVNLLLYYFLVGCSRKNICIKFSSTSILWASIWWSVMYRRSRAPGFWAVLAGCGAPRCCRKIPLDSTHQYISPLIPTYAPTILPWAERGRTPTKLAIRAHYAPRPSGGMGGMAGGGWWASSIDLATVNSCQ
jgi:hypothetical protein